MFESKGFCHLYWGNGKGKTAAALGEAIRMANAGKEVVVIQFLKGSNSDKYEILKRLEPEIRWFYFEKNEQFFEHLTDKEKEDEKINIRNSL